MRGRPMSCANFPSPLHSGRRAGRWRAQRIRAEHHVASRRLAEPAMPNHVCAASAAACQYEVIKRSGLERIRHRNRLLSALAGSSPAVARRGDPIGRHISSLRGACRSGAAIAGAAAVSSRAAVMSDDGPPMIGVNHRRRHIVGRLRFDIDRRRDIGPVEHRVGPIVKVGAPPAPAATTPAATTPAATPAATTPAATMPAAATSAATMPAAATSAATLRVRRSRRGGE
jgi:hypothetical protein